MRYLFIVTILAVLQPVLFAQDWQLYHSSSHPVSDDFVRSATLDSSHTIWFGTNSGLMSYSEDSWSNFILNTTVFDIANTHSDSNLIWLATGSGMHVYQVIKPDSIEVVESYTADNSEILSNTCYAITIDQNGLPWVGTDSGISVLVDHNWVNLETEINLLNEKSISNLQKRDDGLVYAATRGGGVSRLSYSDLDGITGASVIVEDWSGLPSDTINTILFDAEDKAWYGTDYGIATHTGTNTKRHWENYSEDDGLAGNKVLSFFEDADSVIWIGTSNGVSAYSGTFRNSWQASDLPGGDSVLTITQHSNGTIWLGTNNGIISGNPVLVSVNDPEITVQNQMTLDIYPNPFETFTSISYYLPLAGDCRIKLVTLSGQVVKTILEGKLQSGYHSCTLAAGDLPKGMYLIVLESNTISLAKKILIQ